LFSDYPVALFMEIRHLRSFFAVAEFGHFGRAADALGIAQSALSRHVQTLENELGGRVFDRSSRSVQLTPAGEALRAELAPIFEDLEASLARIRRIAQGEAEVIHLSLAPNFAYAHAANLISEMRKVVPGVQLVCHDFALAHQRNALLRGQIDLATTNLRIESKDLVREFLWDEPFVAILPADHRLAVRDCVSLIELAQEPFVSCPRYKDSGFHELVLQPFEKAGIIPNFAESIDSKAVMAQVIAAGYGFTLLPKSALSLELPGCVGLIVSDDGCSIANYLVWSPSRDRPALRKVRAHIRKLSFDPMKSTGTA
jgi:DNA-binding transcriptional LysR family regulator